jgi:hypothetical protein
MRLKPLLLVVTLLCVGQTHAKEIKSMVPSESGAYPSTINQRFYSGWVNTQKSDNILRYLDLSIFFGIDPRKATRYADGTVRCDRCSNNTYRGLVDKLLYKSDLLPVGSPRNLGGCTMKPSIDQHYTARAPERMVTNGQGTANDTFWLHTRFVCDSSPFTPYAEPRMVASSNAKWGGKPVKLNPNLTCGIEFSQDRVAVLFGGQAITMKTSTGLWEFNVSEFVDFLDQSESVQTISVIKPTNGVVRGSKLSELDLRVVYEEPISHAQKPSVKTIRHFTPRPFRLLTVELEQNAAVALHLVDGASQTNIKCALKSGLNGFNDAVNLAF